MSYTVQEVDRAFVLRFASESRPLLHFMPFSPAEAKFERDILGSLDVAIFYGGRAFAVIGDKGGCLSINVSKFQRKPKQNAWGRYLNCYYAYTPVPFRRHGHAKRLLEHVEAVALADGQHRIKSLVASFYGFVLHRAMGHDFWGVDAERLELVVDAPLGKRAGNAHAFPEGPPVNVRKVCPVGGRAMADEQLLAALTDPGGKYRIAEDTARRALAESPKPCAP